MQNILSLLQKGLEICFKFRHIDLKGFCFRTLCHCFIKHIKGHGLPQIIRVYRSIQFIMKTDIMDISILKVFQR